jgi:hypothetical protein
MAAHEQIRITQAGAELFGFETITWPGEVFQYPIVYEVCAMNKDSYEARKLWKWIHREQYEWLLRHYSCMVSYVGADISDGHTFFCNNHQCWEQHGKDYFATEQPPEVYIEPDMDEERKI